MQPMVISGYAIVFNQKTLLWESEGVMIYEVIDPRALEGVDLSNVILRYNHSDQIMQVSGTKNNSLVLTVDNVGLHFKATLSNTTTGKDLFEMVRSKLLNKMSFAFVRESDHIDTDTKTITITKFKRIIEISCVDFPAYPGTSCNIVDPEVERLRGEILTNIKRYEEQDQVRALKKEMQQLEVQRLKAEIFKNL